MHCLCCGGKLQAALPKVQPPALGMPGMMLPSFRAIIDPFSPLMPVGATVFTATGNKGSALYIDDEDRGSPGECLMIYICDECLEKNTTRALRVKLNVYRKMANGQPSQILLEPSRPANSPLSADPFVPLSTDRPKRPRK